MPLHLSNKKCSYERIFVFLQVAALALSSANGLLLKGGKEASHSNKALMDVVKEALATVGAQDAISLVSYSQSINDDSVSLRQILKLAVFWTESFLIHYIAELNNNEIRNSFWRIDSYTFDNGISRISQKPNILRFVYLSFVKMV